MTKQDNKLFIQTTCQPTITFTSEDAEFEVGQVCNWDYDVDENGNVVNLHLNDVSLERIR